jgi:hypothetical protein
MYTINYKFNLFPGCPTTKTATVRNLTAEGIVLLLRNLQTDALKGIEVKNVTINKTTLGK